MTKWSEGVRRLCHRHEDDGAGRLAGEKAARREGPRDTASRPGPSSRARNPAAKTVTPRGVRRGDLAVRAGSNDRQGAASEFSFDPTRGDGAGDRRKGMATNTVPLLMAQLGRGRRQYGEWHYNGRSTPRIYASGKGRSSPRLEDRARTERRVASGIFARIPTSKVTDTPRAAARRP